MNGLLLDTHVWLWLHTAPHRLGNDLLELLADQRNDLFLSAASAWEIAIKHSIGRLPLPKSPHLYVPERMALSGTTPLPVEQHHALAVAALPMHHRDPFDRLLIAQARSASLTLVTADRAFDAYDVRTRLVPR